MNWKTVKKIDAHIHTLPKERIEELSKKSKTPWTNSDIETILKKMDNYNIEKSILVPNNDSKTYYNMRKTNEFFAEIINKYPDRFIAFSDFELKDTDDMFSSAEELDYAVKELGLKGLKIHPTNLNVNFDDLKLIPVLRKAAELKIPVMVHSFPQGRGFYDTCSPLRINRMVQAFPDIKFIIAHMGGIHYFDLFYVPVYIDISIGIFQIEEIYGSEITKNILRKFGAKRLLFATDYPEVDQKDYFEFLDSFNFTDQEIENIAYNNIKKLLNI